MELENAWTESWYQGVSRRHLQEKGKACIRIFGICLNQHSFCLVKYCTPHILQVIPANAMRISHGEKDIFQRLDARRQRPRVWLLPISR